MLAHEYLFSRWVHVQNSDAQHVFVQIWKMSWLPDANSVLGADLDWFDCLIQVNISGSIYLLIIQKLWSFWLDNIVVHYTMLIPRLYSFGWFLCIDLLSSADWCWVIVGDNIEMEWRLAEELGTRNSMSNFTASWGVVALWRWCNAKTLSQLRNYKILMALASISHYPLLHFQLDILYFLFDKNMMRQI